MFSVNFRQPLRIAVMCTLTMATACISPAAPTAAYPVASTSPSATAAPTLAATASTTPTPAPTSTPTATPLPTVESLKATVTADLLSCLYGPGPNYLFLYGLRKGANIRLIGRANEENWHWVYVDGTNKCWVNTTSLEVQGNWLSLPIVYPGLARLPVSPYYPPTTVLSAVRQKNEVTVAWTDIPLRAGDEEDERMQHYVVEVWRCESGHILFEPLATNDLSITFIDEPGCSEPSHGRVFVQEKHGFSGPTEIPWPAY